MLDQSTFPFLCTYTTARRLLLHSGPTHCHLPPFPFSPFPAESRLGERLLKAVVALARATVDAVGAVVPERHVVRAVAHKQRVVDVLLIDGLAGRLERSDDFCAVVAYIGE